MSLPSRRLALPWGLLLALAVVIAVSVLYIDRPLALFCTHLQRVRLLFQLCAAPSLLALFGGITLCAAALLQRLRGRPLPPAPWLSMAIATIVGLFAKDVLKFIIGRPWPHTWLSDHIYTLHPFTTGDLYGAFPSGHTTYIAAPMCVMWTLRPAARPFAGTVIALVMAGLVLANYHFLSDVLAGLMLGIFSANLTRAVLNR